MDDAITLTKVLVSLAVACVGATVAFKYAHFNQKHKITLDVIYQLMQAINKMELSLTALQSEICATESLRDALIRNRQDLEAHRAGTVMTFGHEIEQVVPELETERSDLRSRLAKQEDLGITALREMREARATIDASVRLLRLLHGDSVRLIERSADVFTTIADTFDPKINTSGVGCEEANRLTWLAESVELTHELMRFWQRTMDFFPGVVREWLGVNAFDNFREQLRLP